MKVTASIPVLALLGLCATGCGEGRKISGSPNDSTRRDGGGGGLDASTPPPPGNAVEGTPLGGPFQVAAAAYMYTVTTGRTGPLSTFAIHFDTAAVDACQTNTEAAPAHRSLLVGIFRDTEGLGPGTYALSEQGGHASFTRDEPGTLGDTTISAEAGSITLEALSASMAKGSFRATFAGQEVTGTFNLTYRCGTPEPSPNPITPSADGGVPGTHGVGAACSDIEPCAEPYVCTDPVSGGFCTRSCTTSRDCPGGVCVFVPDIGWILCLAGCTPEGGCEREGAVCVHTPDNPPYCLLDG